MTKETERGYVITRELAREICDKIYMKGVKRNGMENDKPSPTTNIEDTLLVAFMVFKGHQIKEWKSDNGHVSFDILGEPDKIEKDMADYYDPNYCVSITEFVRCFKEVKSRMYNFKNLNVTIKKEKE